jgi:UDP-N-acetylglucosamine--N-acetylmuramyl-(pentapeptide) pyrophosphoryl-undecaprenol N-acetylglucosamine transferase
MIERIIVAGGGTGGHLFPGLAVVEELRRRQPSVDVLFVGTERGIEARVLPKRGERLATLDVRPLKGRSPGELLRSVGVLPAAMAQATRIVRRERPSLVLGVGGYAAGPMVAAAAALGVPTALLEQNAEIGLTNRLLSTLVGRAYVTFPETEGDFRPTSVRVVGNPVRRTFVDVARQAAADPEGFEARARHVLVLGGSQGAKSLNERVPEALSQAGVMSRGYRVLHQTGSAMRAEVAERYRELGIEADVVDFIDDMGKAYRDAAVVVSRAGATTVAELVAVGRPAIFVPYPYAAGDHQRRNAEALERHGAALAVRDEELEPARLARLLSTLLDDPAHRRSMGEAARRLGRPDAAAAIVDDLCAWLGCPAPRARTEPPPAVEGTSSEDDAGSAGARARPLSAPPPHGLRGQRPYVPTLPPPPMGVTEPRAPRRALLAHPSLLE